MEKRITVKCSVEFLLFQKNIRQGWKPSLLPSLFCERKEVIVSFDKNETSKSQEIY